MVGRGAYLHIKTMKNEIVKKRLLKIFPDGYLPIISMIPAVIDIDGKKYYCYRIDENRLRRDQREKLIQLYLEINEERGTPITREELEEKIRKYGWLIRGHSAVVSDNNIWRYL